MRKALIIWISLIFIPIVSADLAMPLVSRVFEIQMFSSMPLFLAICAIEALVLWLVAKRVKTVRRIIIMVGTAVVANIMSSLLGIVIGIFVPLYPKTPGAGLMGIALFLAFLISVLLEWPIIKLFKPLVFEVDENGTYVSRPRAESKLAWKHAFLLTVAMNVASYVFLGCVYFILY